MILATCPRGISEILAKEVTDLGYTVNAVLPAGVEIDAPYEAVYTLNLCLRTAHRVLYRLGSWSCATADDMYQAVRSVAWEEWIPKDGYLSVVSSVDTPEIDNTQFANVRCKDAIVDRLRITTGIRPDSGSNTDSTVIFLFWKSYTCMVYADTSGKPLSERGYRIHPGKAPLRESLAAALVLKCVWDGASHFINPMCGSGTLAIEAAMIARNMQPGTMRENFGLLHLLPTVVEEFERKKIELEDAEVLLSPSMNIVATDHDAQVIKMAQQNARSAGVASDIRFAVCDFRSTPIPEPLAHSANNVVMLNPEYGIRLGNETELVDTYRAIGDFFKQRCIGYTGYVFTGNMMLTKEVGLRAKTKTPFWTADIECRLLEYELYGEKRDN